MKPDEVQAAYWQGPVSRLEVQKIFDEYTAGIVEMRTRLLNLDFAVGALAEKLGITPEDVNAYATRKMAEFEARKNPTIQ